jgi:DNA-binding response OmpR family regulator
MTREAQKGTVLILMIEANGLVRFKFTEALQQEGYQVVWAATVEEAVKAYERYRIDLLLLDLNGPLTDDCEAFERLSALNPLLRIIILTQQKTEFEQASAERVGALIEKPIRLSALIQTMNMLLGPPVQPDLRVFNTRG